MVTPGLPNGRCSLLCYPLCNKLSRLGSSYGSGTGRRYPYLAYRCNSVLRWAFETNSILFVKAHRADAVAMPVTLSGGLKQINAVSESVSATARRSLQLSEAQLAY